MPPVVLLSVNDPLLVRSPNKVNFLLAGAVPRTRLPDPMVRLLLTVKLLFTVTDVEGEIFKA